ncbi:MAG: hypothetical protein IRY98_04920 [Alicyclobacillaceae bacterium]|nr:hypothetical protein [Alicyclobacillaceae bacterium]
MNDKESMLNVLQAQEQLLAEMLGLGEQILQSRERGYTIDQILAWMDSRKKVFRQLEKLALPGDLRVVDLLDHPEAEVREKAHEVRARFEAVVDQDRRLKTTLLNLLGEVGDALLTIQQSLKSARSYRQQETIVDGVFFDRRG